ncbi:hypothetical protein BKA64DRAFT_143923 [Cadophora sp. MPI-SDFR-AT-0126]|nr:hypothetical protein BKA64DRAFT_143923 [Leotiomycetes sp. MPI-SDFR-AT-0126]
MANPTSSAWKIIPEFQSLSIPSTVKFYTTELGFEIGGIHQSSSDPEPTFCSLANGPKSAANIYFRLCKADEFRASTAWVGLGTKELDAFYGKLVDDGRVVIAEKIEDKEWGYRQFTVCDLDGNRVTFFKFLEGGNPGTE